MRPILNKINRTVTDFITHASHICKAVSATK